MSAPTKDRVYVCRSLKAPSLLAAAGRPIRAGCSEKLSDFGQDKFMATLFGFLASCEWLFI